jgi:hypothetical protein
LVANSSRLRLDVVTFHFGAPLYSATAKAAIALRGDAILDSRGTVRLLIQLDSRTPSAAKPTRPAL